MLTEITAMFMNELKCCPRCGKWTIYDDSYYIENKPIVVVACMCGNREYLTDSKTKEYIKLIEEPNG